MITIKAPKRVCQHASTGILVRNPKYLFPYAIFRRVLMSILYSCSDVRGLVGFADKFPGNYQEYKDTH